MFDIDAEAARLTRRRIAERLIQNKLLLAGDHLTGAATGELATVGNGYEFTPMSA